MSYSFVSYLLDHMVTDMLLVRFFKTLSQEQHIFLELLFSHEEIKKMDVFTFAFFKRYWELLVKDAVSWIGYFHATNECNLSFTSLISKVFNLKSIKDFHPISLIGCQY